MPLSMNIGPQECSYHPVGFKLIASIPLLAMYKTPVRRSFIYLFSFK